MTDITLPRATVEQALEALKYFRDTAICSADIDSANEVIPNLEAALAQQAEPQDAELSAALGWPGGISEPVLDRKVLLQKVAALMQDKLWEDHRVSHLWGHMPAQQAEPVEPVARVVEHGATVRLEWVSADAAHNAKVGPLFSMLPQRKPLTKEEIRLLARDTFLEAENIWNEDTREDLTEFTRAVERAHGIGRQSDPQIEDRLARHGIPKP